MIVYRGKVSLCNKLWTKLCESGKSLHESAFPKIENYSCDANQQVMGVVTAVAMCGLFSVCVFCTVLKTFPGPSPNEES